MSATRLKTKLLKNKDILGVTIALKARKFKLKYVESTTQKDKLLTSVFKTCKKAGYNAMEYKVEKFFTIMINGMSC